MRQLRSMMAVVSLAALALSGCALDRGADGSVAAGGALDHDAERLLLVTIDNPTEPSLNDAGSTPHGYERIGSYSAGARSRATAAALARDYDLQSVRQWPIAPLQVQCVVFRIAPDADRAQVLQRLSADPRVHLAQPMQLFGSLGNQITAVAPAYNDPYFNLQHGFADIDAAAAQQYSRGEGVSIAIIDTGVDVRHPDLAGRIALARNFIDSDERGFESDRHGTEVAGIIGAVANNGVGIVGIAPAARLQIYKACRPLQAHGMEASCNSFTLALALSAAIEAHAQIVNLSLGGPADPLLSQLVQYGLQRHMVYVGAVPPNGRLDGFPLNISGVIAVEQSGTPSTSAEVLHAPGREILSLAPDGHYDFATGSSFATAHVSGALALLRARLPQSDATTLRDMLAHTNLSSSAGASIDVCAALAASPARIECAPSSRAIAAVGEH